MQKIDGTVLITTANLPPDGMPFVQMSSPVMRRITAKAALYTWVAQGVSRIVLADATGTDLLTQAEVAELATLGTEIEQVSYRQDGGLVSRKGKGYGEGLLIRHALDRSRLLAGERSFFKCTGKLYVRNFAAIAGMIAANRVTDMYWKAMSDEKTMAPLADCRFYYTTKAFAAEHLVPAYLESDDASAACEYCVFQTLSRRFATGTAPRPVVSGFSGGTGQESFDRSLGDLDQRFPCWVAIAP